MLKLRVNKSSGFAIYLGSLIAGVKLEYRVREYLTYSLNICELNSKMSGVIYIFVYFKSNYNMI